MTPERWKHIRDLFDAALEQPLAGRSAFLMEAAGADVALREEVLGLLEAEEETSGLLDDSPVSAPLIDMYEGRRVGPYQLLSRLGSGGMGAVYAAERTDGEFKKLVAVKMVRPGMEAASMMRRFRNERQILAALDHPLIARLLDGGTTEEGLPYLVMEYVEGVPIDAYCERNQLSIAQRLELFAKVCEAVQHAHRNLVVHRDLKPANILVTPDGSPKLLDFGIAKLLRAEYSQQTMGMTRAGLQPMTPEYASPEQVRGEAVTTATDVYSLGVILYLLLTGKLPSSFESYSPTAIVKAVVETEAKAPSLAVEGRLRKTLEGDLDAITLTALRKEPNRRYASADRLCDDVRCYLNGLPVTARQESARYRVGKFFARNRALAAAVAIAIFALVGGATSATYFAIKAQRRFEESRKLARFVLFEFDDALKEGETVARKKWLEEAVKHLTRLSADTWGDASLRNELAEGWIHVGDVQGNPTSSNTGDNAEAKASYTKAWELAPPASKARRSANLKLIHLASMLGDKQEALTRSKAALEELTGKERMQTLFETASIEYQMGDYAGAIAHYREAEGIAQSIIDNEPRDKTAQRSRNNIWLSMGRAMVKGGSGEEGSAYLDRAREAFERALAVDPTAQARRSLFAAVSLQGDLAASSGDAKKAVDLYKRGAEISAELLAADPGNARAKSDLAMAVARLAFALGKTGAVSEAEAEARKAEAILRPLVDKENPAATDLQNYAYLLAEGPGAGVRLGLKALPYADKAVKLTKESDPLVMLTFAQAHGAARDFAEAIRWAEKALAKTPADQPPMREQIEAELAKFRAAAGK